MQRLIVSQIAAVKLFQSSSGPKTGCNVSASRVEGGPTVSILIRPEDRMQQLVPVVPNVVGVFQSSSGPKTGCNQA